ncbi:TolC family outer membrane protein [Methylocystis sp. 9N]|uniref:TolC family outer membrane protein n=1 Tax=Methylocystis borbori TaxID=3118750 RepID=A0ABU7XFY2_9HYPH
MTCARTATAETISSALARAYSENPDLNEQRADVRAHDEDVSGAWAGLRPNANIQANVSTQSSNLKIPIRLPVLNQRVPYTFSDTYTGYPRGATLNVSQHVFDGGRTENSVRRAESGVFESRALMQLSEQETLRNGATAFMDVLRDAAILSLRKSNIAVLNLQLHDTQKRYESGDVTNTDIAQSEASVSHARSDYFAAEAQLKSSSAVYRQIIGVEPKRLEPASSIERMLPNSVKEAIDIALLEHPAVVASLHRVDAAESAVKVAEGSLLPTLSVNAQVSQQYDSFLGLPGSRQFAAGVGAALNVPLYQGGSEYSSIRKAKEIREKARLNADAQRARIRANVVTSYSLLDTARSQIKSDEATVKAAELALKGVREEAQAGQRTTLDVLNAQQTLLNARVNLVISQRDRVVASYAALASIGRLNAEALNLNVARYNPVVHFEQVKDKWFGVSTPDQ